MNASSICAILAQFFRRYQTQIFNIILPFVVFVGVAAACSNLNKQANLPDDNLIEEVVEAIIEDRLNIDVDLTPETPEKHGFHK